jgi:ATP-dependent RNA circularization protein (DNA/RNA ligase family)
LPAKADQLIGQVMDGGRKALVFKKENGTQYLIKRIQREYFMVWGEYHEDDPEDYKIKYYPIGRDTEFYTHYEKILNKLRE